MSVSIFQRSKLYISTNRVFQSEINADNLSAILEMKIAGSLATPIADRKHQASLGYEMGSNSPSSSRAEAAHVSCDSPYEIWGCIVTLPNRLFTKRKQYAACAAFAEVCDLKAARN